VWPPCNPHDLILQRRRQTSDISSCGYSSHVLIGIRVGVTGKRGLLGISQVRSQHQAAEQRYQRGCSFHLYFVTPLRLSLVGALI